MDTVDGQHKHVCMGLRTTNSPGRSIYLISAQSGWCAGTFRFLSLIAADSLQCERFTHPLRCKQSVESFIATFRSTRARLTPALAYGTDLVWPSISMQPYWRSRRTAPPLQIMAPGRCGAFRRRCREPGRTQPTEISNDVFVPQPLLGADKQSLWAAVRESGSHPHLIALTRIESLPFHRSQCRLSHCIRGNTERLADT